jgi:lipoprotein Spr
MRKLLTLVVIPIFIFSCRSTKDNSSSNQNKHKELKEKYAKILGVKESEVINTKLYLFIDEWYGVPYKYAGKDKTGIDCSGLTCQLYKSVYSRNLQPPATKIIELCETVKESNLKEGDLVFYKIESNKITHVGVYLQNKKFLHASSKKGVMISSMDEPYFKKYFYKGGRLKHAI